MSDPTTTFIKRRAPTLYGIIAFKLIKGSLLLGIAISVHWMSGGDLAGIFRDILEFFHIDPEKKFFADLTERIADITPKAKIWLARGTVLYSLFSLVEGVGLVFRVSWAGWLAIGESGFFIPIEVFELIRKPNLGVTAVLAVNVVIVWYLLQNRQRLFRHHHH